MNTNVKTELKALFTIIRYTAGILLALWATQQVIWLLAVAYQ
jgi:hypothetical protein